MTFPNGRIVVFIVFLAVCVTQAQETFSIIGIEGSARVQRSQKRAWEKLEIGEKLGDNDLVETFFQTKLLLQFGEANMVILGSNSKVLLNISAKTVATKKKVEASLTLFSGGVFSKAINNCRINIYTANAVGVLDSGSVTTVAEGKTGETGFQVLGGMVFVRNIAQQKGIELRSGLTTMIQPNKEPTAPLYITLRHVAVLKHFFGDEYISSELDASGIKPTEERRGGGQGRSAFAQKMRDNVDEGMYKPLFSLNRIYGSILADQEATSYFYRPLYHGGAALPVKTVVSLNTDIGIAGAGVSPRIIPACTWHLGKFDAGVRLSFVKPADAPFTAGFSSLAGILDKIDHVSLGGEADRASLNAGALDGITFGYGLLVDDFSNTGRNNCFHPLGFSGRLRIGRDVLIQVFTSEVAAPWVSGIYFAIEPSTYHFGIGYVADFNQYANPPAPGSMRYSVLPKSDSLYPDVYRQVGGVHCYSLDLGVDVVDQYDLQVLLTAEFAQRLYGGSDGLILRLPSLKANVKKISFGGGLISESARLLSGQFNAFYMDNRYRIKSDLESQFVDTLITPNNVLSRDRRTFGLQLFFKFNPVPGTDIDFMYKQDIKESSTLNVVTSDSTTSRDMPGNFSFKLRGAINDTLVKFFRYAEITLQQSHGRLFPAGGVPFKSWTFDGAYLVQLKPFFLDIAIETAGRFFYIDSGRKPDDRITSDDFVAEFRVGFVRGFK